MAKTFTGLKLLGQLGRFVKTEISNVIGVFSMADEKVISGCEWGNILVWGEKFIEIEVKRKFRQPCHSAPIIMFLYSKLDVLLTSISMDGRIKFWNYRTIDMADPSENNRVLEIEPTYEISVQDSIGESKIMGMSKIDSNPKLYDYFIQDGNGGMWLVDIEVSKNAKPLRRLAKFHGGMITSLQPSPIGYFIATTSMDGWLHIYDVINKKLIFTHNFKVPITSSIWLPQKIACSRNIFIVGFQTGILKIVTIPLKNNIEKRILNYSEIEEIQSSKPHKSSINYLSLNNSAKILLCGGEDKTVFAYKIKVGPIKLSPIGFFSLPGKVTFVHWKPSKKDIVLISCASGHIVEVKVPTSRPSYTIESFLLKLELREIQTVSIKEQNPGVEIDEDLYFEDSEEDETPPKTYIPPIPNSILFAIYTPSESGIWVSIDGYDAGFLYEYDLETSNPVANAHITIPDKNNTPLTAIKVVGTDPIKIFMGFADGRIRLTNVKDNDISDFGDYIEYSVHDNKTGRLFTILEAITQTTNETDQVIGLPLADALFEPNKETNIEFMLRRSEFGIKNKKES
ncbi:cilia- and flagella-associated protein 44-like [Melanaphis sacchari]|uniref:cilia- and flagella-associated protein 44-like n=1 Tax=Melanaphis sacchari TaxID=742174 RepID=UPI000DC15998|nr:cilia- and flagella-associated protein 44-like [Melanaphis sacchari]